jgi:NADPH-dependent ferric siderophore reductase
MSLFESLAKLVTLSANVIYKEKIKENIYHLRIQGNALLNLNYIPGYHLRIFVGLGRKTAFRDNIRTYSIWNYNAAEGIIDLAICAHSTGIGSQWIRDVEVGETIHFSKPKGKFILDATGDYYLFIGDLTALGHLYEIRRHLQPQQQAVGFTYTAQPEDFFEDIEQDSPFHLLPVSFPNTDKLKEAIKDYITNQKGKGIVYLGGDGRVCVELNHYFRKELQWSTSQIKTKPFWHPDKKGLE